MRVALPYPHRAHPLIALGADYSSRRLIESFHKYTSHIDFEIFAAGGGISFAKDALRDPRDQTASSGVQPSSWDLLHDVRPAGDPRRHFYLRFALNGSFPIVHTHHALNYPSYLDGYFLPLLLAGSQPFDAVVCHSKSSRQAFSELLAISAEGLATLGGGRPPKFRGQLPIIPNGVDTDRFRPHGMSYVRQALDVPQDVFLILWLGRLSRSTKADLMPLLIAHAELRERNPDRDILLVLVGTDGEGYSKILEASADALGLRSCVRIERVKPQDPIDHWYSAADVFVSPVDNVQETFGNTVIEAMAAGVPQVVSDWNGYRDIVVHGETGFRVRTFWAPCDDDAVAQWAAWGNSRRAQELLAQAVACDLGEMVGYLEQLLRSAELRRVMSAASRKRAVTHFAWPVIVGRYVECWMDLHERSRADGWIGVEPQSIMPAFYRAFHGYASQVLREDSRLRLRHSDALATGGAHGVISGEQLTGSQKDGLRKVISATSDAEAKVTLGELIATVVGDDYSATDVTRLLLRGIKYGLVEVIADDTGQT